MLRATGEAQHVTVTPMNCKRSTFKFFIEKSVIHKYVKLAIYSVRDLSSDLTQKLVVLSMHQSSVS